MSNERLKAAMVSAGIDADRLAEEIEVETKTVGRWLSGRTPYRRHRMRIAALLDTPAHQLWPDADQAPPPDPPQSEILAAYPNPDDPGAPEWRELLEEAIEQVDLLDLTLAHILPSPEAVELLTGKANSGCRIRILTSSPESIHLLIAAHEQGQAVTETGIPQLAHEADRTVQLLQPHLALPHFEARKFVAPGYHTILRFDQQMLITPHLYRATPADGPLLHFQRTTDGQLFDKFAAHYDAIWRHATPCVDGGN